MVDISTPKQGVQLVEVYLLKAVEMSVDRFGGYNKMTKGRTLIGLKAVTPTIFVKLSDRRRSKHDYESVGLRPSSICWTGWENVWPINRLIFAHCRYIRIGLFIDTFIYMVIFYQSESSDKFIFHCKMSWQPYQKCFLI